MESPHQPPTPSTPNPFTSQTPSPFSTPSLATRLERRNPALHAKITQMALPLAPLVQLTTGDIHPVFPKTLLAFWLLTDAELDALAHFYHQRTPCPWTAHYPCPVAWPAGLPLEEKRRKMGKFIGLRGCESPTAADGEAVLGVDLGRLSEGEEGVVDAARRARDEEEEVRRKLGWYY